MSKQVILTIPDSVDLSALREMKVILRYYKDGNDLYEYSTDSFSLSEAKGDLISREALKDFAYINKGNFNTVEGIREWIDNAPTVCGNNPKWCESCISKGKCASTRPQGEWISVSERLPENRDWYLGLFKEPDTDFIGIPYICDYVGEVTKGTTNEGWILRHCTDVDTVPDYFRNLICVAWQPLPEPYKKGGAEE